MADQNGVLLDVAGAAAHLGVSEAFVRRLVLERRVRYFKVGKLLRFRPSDLDAFVEAGRRDPVVPWVHSRSPQRRATGRSNAQSRPREDSPNAATKQRKAAPGR